MLGLHQNNLTDLSAAGVASVLTFATTAIETVQLCSNNFTDAGAVVIATAAVCSRSVQVFEMSRYGALPSLAADFSRSVQVFEMSRYGALPPEP
jgi:hypothetical protein